jgi:RNA polymerase sigma-70 factor (ECF subfamily)
VDERELVIAAIKGDRDAFGRLMEIVAEPAARTAYGILRNRADAEDAVQQAAVSTFRGIHTLRDPNKFRAWFFRAVVNQSLDMLSQRRDDPPIDQGRPSIQGASPDVDRSIDLSDAVESLSNRHREVILLRSSGLSTREIAESMDRPLGTVQRWLSEAYRTLRQSLGSEYDYRHRRHGS